MKLPRGFAHPVGGPIALPRTSLRARVVVIVVVAVVLAITVFGIVVLAAIRADRISRVDALLEGRSFQLLNNINLYTSSETNPFPSDYVVVIDQVGRPGVLTIESTARTEIGMPRVSDILVQARERFYGQPFTVPPDESGTPWRVLTLATDRNGSTVSVALPLDADEVVRELGLRVLFFGLVIAALAALTGWWAVNRSLWPLRSVETTAAAIAAGDFSQRVPEGNHDTEIGRLTTALNGMLGHIEDAIATRDQSRDRMRQFVADASHELRTPLAAIRGYAELHRQGAVPADEVDATFARVENEARRMGRLVEDLLLLARLDEQRPLHHDPVDLLVLIDDTAAAVRALDPTREVRVSGAFGGPVHPTTVTGDNDRLRQVLANLAGNAVRHTPAGSPVELVVTTTVAAGTTWAVVDVVDHGRGIAEADRTRVFERFTRLDASRTRGAGGGAGLGLSIVAGVVAAHAGRVEVVATPGGGATFRLWLPQVVATAAGPDAAPLSDSGEQLAGREVPVHT